MAREKKLKTPNPDRLPVGKFFAWKSRDVSLAAMNTIVLGYLSIYASTALGMDPALVGTLILVSKIVDAFTDLVAGYMVDNTRTKWGRARPYEICIIGVWISTILMFSASPSWSGTAKAIWLFCTYTFNFSIFATFLGANQTPYNIRAFSNNKNVITKVASYGGIVTMIFGVIVSTTFPILMARLATSAHGWTTLLLIYGVPMTLIGVLRMLLVKEDPAIDEGNNDKVDIKEILTMMKRNKYCWIYAGIMFAYYVISGLGAGIYYFNYIIGNPSMFSIVSALSVIMLPVMFIFPGLIRKYNVSQLYLFFAILSMLGYLIVFVGGSNLVVVMVGIVISTLINLPLGYLGALVVMQLATYNEYNGMARMDASSNILAGFANKVGGGVGTWLAGVLLAASGFIATTEGMTAAQPESALFMIRMLYSIIPMIFAGVIALLAWRLSFLSKKVPEMEAELKARKEASVSNPQEA